MGCAKWMTPAKMGCAKWMTPGGVTRNPVFLLYLTKGHLFLTDRGGTVRRTMEKFSPAAGELTAAVGGFYGVSGLT